MKKRLTAMLLLMVLLTGCAGGTAPADGDTSAPNQMQGGFPGLGGVMPEMSFQTAAGETLTLSGLLEEKELVVLNFWFENCGWCLREFPVMELAYQRYREDVQIVALNPSDGAEAVKKFQQSKSLSFSMVACPRSWAAESGVSAYPTSIFIDRDGVVCLIHVGAITQTEMWYALFDAFTGEDYERKIYESIEELMQ